MVNNYIAEQHLPHVKKAKSRLNELDRINSSIRYRFRRFHLEYGNISRQRPEYRLHGFSRYHTNPQTRFDSEIRRQEDILEYYLGVLYAEIEENQLSESEYHNLLRILSGLFSAEYRKFEEAHRKIKQTI